MFNFVNNCIHTNEAADHTAVPKDAFPWWEVDLGRTYPVLDITVWERYGYSSRLFPFVITVDDAICVMMTSDPERSSRQNSLKCASVLYGRKVRITLLRTDQSLNLCEFQIWVPKGVSQCEAGMWGPSCHYFAGCNEKCGKGHPNNFCDQGNGTCYDGCVAGRYGDWCDTPCRRGCLNNVCDRQTGLCTECYGNYHGGNCTDCVAGKYGHFCSLSCRSSGCLDNSCDKTTGLCADCPQNFVGSLCDGCIAGQHGCDCSFPCLSSSCLNNQCNRTTGLCDQCPENLTGYLCDECNPGRHGENCSIPCLSSNCSNDQCDRETGLCVACPDGLIGGLCTVNHMETTSTVKYAERKGDDGTGKIIGAIFGVGLLMTITGVAVFCWYRRSKIVAEENIEETVPKVEPTHVGNMLPNTANQSWSAPRDESEHYEIGDEEDIYEPMRQGSNDDTSAADVNPNKANISVSAKVVPLSSAQCDIKLNTDYEITDCESSYDGLRPYSNVDANVEPYAELHSQDSEIRETEQVYVNTAFAESMIVESEVLTGEI
ncbi:uncharacterized protein [Littorina saxatilis]|uniref:EGF-like domain-containing protein n=1 Tax=Littorina saxatilis TaxID=31220 RepID=A0AAN9AY92_9CAEN